MRSSKRSSNPQQEFWKEESQQSNVVLQTQLIKMIWL
jgi:hypothetical protein